MQDACLNEARLNGAKFYGVKMQGADLYEARLQLAILTDVNLQAGRIVRASLQGATLAGVHLGGVNPDMPSSMKERIWDRIDVPAILTETIFQGGLTEQDVASILEAASASDRDPNELKASLDLHIGEPASDEPESNGVFTAPYTAEEAERWIAEYEQAMSEVSKDDS